MKTRFTTLDVCAALSEIQENLVGLRVANVYDADNKTYLFKLAKPDMKAMLVVESGIRIHTSEFDLPKNPMPSGFSMKMRKHLRGRRLVHAKQLGIDRILDLQFGSDDAAYHVIVELYDRGNIALTDSKYTILNLLRYRKDNADSDVRIAVHEIYPLQSAKARQEFITKDALVEVLQKTKKGDLLKRVLNPHFPYGTACIEHCLSLAGILVSTKIDEELKSDLDFVEKLHSALQNGEEILDELIAKSTCKGFIIQKQDKKSDGEVILTNVEYHPYLFDQHSKMPFIELPSFNRSVDEFYGKMESQKADIKIIQHEKNALKTLNNFKKDHQKRLEHLEKEQAQDVFKANLIEENLEVVDQAIKIVRSAIANQIDWEEINNLIKDAQSKGDPVATTISKLKFETNQIVMQLVEKESLDVDECEEFFSSDEDEKVKKKQNKPVKIEIDLSISAYANAKKYYDKKRQAKNKQQKTIEASEKAFKSAEKKTITALKDVAAVQSIQKARKPFWFEKFLWFITSENYLVLGGRDAQQNEILVRRYLKQGDVYVHADVHGATSCIVKNQLGATDPIPPKSLNEAGTMAICHSAAWDAKVVISAWWVSHEQVSKTAPSGEYLSTGSFLIRGKKNFLPPSFLVYGFGLLFKVDETCVWRHKGERKVRLISEDAESIAENSDVGGEVDISILDESDEDRGNSEIETKEDVDGDEQKSDTAIEKSVLAEGVDKTKEGELDKEEDNSKYTADNITGSVKNVENKSEINFEFPDTNVKVSLAKSEDKYQLENVKDEENKLDDKSDDVVYFGDDQPVNISTNKAETSSKPRMSAKQRRDLKKKNKNNVDDETKTENLNEIFDDAMSIKSAASSAQEPMKRGQKNKLNKIRNKYKDQDEEERKLKMEILQQATKTAGKKAKKQEKQRLRKEAEEKKSQMAKERQNKVKAQVCTINTFFIYIFAICKKQLHLCIC